MSYKKPGNPNELIIGKKKLEELTVEEMFGEGVIGHVLRNKKPLVAFTAIPNEIGEPFVPQFPDARCFLLNQIKPYELGKCKNEWGKENKKREVEKYSELLGIRPGQFGELLDGDPAAIVLVL